MSNFVFEIQAPTIVAAIQQLAAALSVQKGNPVMTAIPQTAEEQAVRQQIVPAPIPAQAPYAAPPAPVNPIPAPQPAIPAAPMTLMPLNAPTSAMPAAPATTYTAPTAMPVNSAPVAAAPTFQIDDLARGAAQLMDAGKHQECRALLTQFQVQGLGDLKPEQFGAFATCLRQMGAKL